MTSVVLVDKKTGKGKQSIKIEVETDDKASTTALHYSESPLQ